MLLAFPQRRCVCEERLPATLLTAVVAVLVLAGPTPATTHEVASPTVTGPIPSQGKLEDPAHAYIFYSTPMNLMKVGYVEQEFLLTGTASAFELVGERSSEGVSRPEYREAGPTPAVAWRWPAPPQPG